MSVDAVFGVEIRGWDVSRVRGRDDILDLVMGWPDGDAFRNSEERWMMTSG